jgi:hypothetical protein
VPAGDGVIELQEIELKEVKSSNILRIGYDAGTLVVEFKSGTKYSFSGVTEKEHQELMEAKSIGSHFHAKIRSKYTGTKIVNL